jgi:hypothetical protein
MPALASTTEIPDDRERDEINNFEDPADQLSRAARPSTRFTVSKLFHEGPPGDPDPAHAFNEIGFYQIDGNPAQCSLLRTPICWGRRSATCRLTFRPRW